MSHSIALLNTISTPTIFGPGKIPFIPGKRQMRHPVAAWRVIKEKLELLACAFQAIQSRMSDFYYSAATHIAYPINWDYSFPLIIRKMFEHEMITQSIDLIHDLVMIWFRLLIQFVVGI